MRSVSFLYSKQTRRSGMASKFIKVLEQATDSTLVESNWEGIITCTDMIRSGEVPAKPALQAIRKRLQHENPHVVSHTLLLLDACVKNCGHKMHTEIATREFMEDFKNLVTDNRYDEVKNKSLEMLQCWATAFANKPEYKMIVDTHNLMKLAGYDFPSLKEADAMFMAQVAPEWQDGDVCYRCRSTFSFLTRKHHCRACGQIFCDKCSSKEMALPQYGIEKEVRVCETCFESKQSENYQREKDKFLTSKVGQFISSKNNDIGLSSSKEVSQEEKEKLLREKEEEDLALALAISQSEAEAKQQEKAKNLYSLYNGTLETTNSPEQRTNPIDGYKGAAELTSSTPPFTESSDDPLAKYLNRDYWQQKKEAKSDEWTNSPAISATAPPPSEPSVAPSICSTLMAPDDNSLNAELAAMSFNGVTNGGISIVGEEIKAHSDETLKWCQSIREQVSVMDNRIKSNLARGRPVFNDSAIQDLFTRLTELHAHVLSRMHTLDEQRGYYESLQDHLANISEARQAINELREEHERKRQERLAEEQRLRQAQMQQTLEMMRMKKHAMLMEQREQALQRFQQQQQEMAMRRQQQQHQFSYYNVPGYSVQQNIVPQYGYHDNQIPNSQQYYQNAPAPVPPLVSSHNVVSGNQYPAQGQNGYQYYPQHQQQQQHMYPQQHNYQQQQQPQNYSNGMNEQPVAQDQQAHSYGQQQVSQHIEQNSHQIDTNQQQSNGQQVVEQPLISFD